MRIAHGLVVASSLSALLVGGALAGCATEPAAPPIAQFSLAQLGQGPLHATGVSRNLATGHLWFLVPGTGLVAATAAGEHVATLPFNQEFVDYGFTDVAVIEDGSFALTANGEAYRYVPGQGVTSYFCLVPGWEEITMENQAVTLDPTTGRIYVAPAYYDTSGATVQARFEVYASADGSYVDGVDVLPSGVIAQGLAYDATLGKLWAVEGNTIYRFAMSGAIEASAQLGGVGRATGLSLIDGQLLVLDGADDEVRLFDRATLLSTLQ